MKSLAPIKKFLTTEVIQIPTIIPLSAITGYAVCGVKCAGIAAGTSVIDLGLKYFKVTDSYYVTYSIMGALLGNNMAEPFVTKYTAFVNAKTSGAEPLTESTNFMATKIEYLSKGMALGTAALGVLTSDMISRAENWLVGKVETKTYTAPKVEPEELHVPPTPPHVHDEV
jgi:hypothetical protein